MPLITTIKPDTELPKKVKEWIYEPPPPPPPEISRPLSFIIGELPGTLFSDLFHGFRQVRSWSKYGHPDLFTYDKGKAKYSPEKLNELISDPTAKPLLSFTEYIAWLKNDPYIFEKLPEVHVDEFNKLRDTYLKYASQVMASAGYSKEQIKKELERGAKIIQDLRWSSKYHDKRPYSKLSSMEEAALGTIVGLGAGGLASRVTEKAVAKAIPKVAEITRSPVVKKVGAEALRGLPTATFFGTYTAVTEFPEYIKELASEVDSATQNYLKNIGFNLALGYAFPPATAAAGSLARKAIKEAAEVLKSPLQKSAMVLHLPQIKQAIMDRLSNGTIPAYLYDRFINLRHGIVNFISEDITKNFNALVKEYPEQINSLFRTAIETMKETDKKFLISEGFIDAEGRIIEENVARIPVLNKAIFLRKEGWFEPDRIALLGSEYDELVKGLNVIRTKIDYPFEAEYKKVLRQLNVVTGKAVEKLQKRIERLERQKSADIKAHDQLYKDFESYIDRLDKFVDKEIKSKRISPDVQTIWGHTTKEFLEKLREGNYLEAREIIRGVIKQVPRAETLFKRILDFGSKNVFFSKTLRQYGSLQRKTIKIEKKVSELSESLETKLAKLQEKLDPSIHKRFSLAGNFFDALRPTTRYSKLSNILRSSEDELLRQFKKTLKQPFYFNIFWDSIKEAEKKDIPKSFVKARVLQALRGQEYSIPVSESIAGIRFPHAISSTSPELETVLKQHELIGYFPDVNVGKMPLNDVVEILRANGINDDVITEVITEATPTLKALKEQIAELIPDRESVKKAFARRIINSLYGITRAERVPMNKAVITTPVSHHFISTPLKSRLAVALEEEKSTTISKLINYLTVLPKGALLSLSPFHAISLLKSHTYSTGEVDFAIKEAFKTSGTIANYYMNLMRGLLNVSILKKPTADYAEKVSSEFIEQSRKLASKELDTMLSRLKEMGIPLTDIPVVLGRTLDIEWSMAGTEGLKGIMRHLVGDVGATGIIFEGLYPYLKTRDMAIVIEQAYREWLTGKNREATLKELFRNIRDVNWKYGGMIELLRQSRGVREVLRSILLAPDWQLSLIKQWTTPLTSLTYRRLHYLSSMLAYNYLMYATEKVKLEGAKDPWQILEDFNTRLFRGKAPFELVGATSNYMFKENYFSYEGEPWDWFHSALELILHGDFSEFYRVFSNRTSMPVRLVSEMTRQRFSNPLTAFGSETTITQFPFLISLPIPIQSILSTKELYGLNFYHGITPALLQSLSTRVYILPASKTLHNMIEHNIYDAYHFKQYVQSQEAARETDELIREALAHYGIRKKTRKITPAQRRQNITNSLVYWEATKNHRHEMISAMHKFEEGDIEGSMRELAAVSNSISEKLANWLNNTVPEEELPEVIMYLPVRAGQTDAKRIFNALLTLIKSSVKTKQKSKYTLEPSEMPDMEHFVDFLNHEKAALDMFEQAK
jgi:hypothetical protein